MPPTVRSFLVQFGIMFANTGHGASPAGATAVVQAAEAGGFTTATAGRDGDTIPVYAWALSKPGDRMYQHIEQLAAVGVTQAIVPTFAPDQLAAIGEDLVARFG